MDIAYFAIGTLLGLVITFFSLRIYSLTKGGSVGWKYIAIVGIAMGIWSISGMVYDFIHFQAEISILIGIAGLFIISFLSPMGTFSLVKDMQLGMNSFFERKNTRRNYIIYYLSILIPVLLYNLFVSPTNILKEIHSSVQLMMVFGIVPMTYSLYILWKGIRKPAWMFMLIFGIIISISQAMAIYVGGCCGEGEALASSDICSSYTLLFVETLPLYCDQAIMSILIAYRSIDLIGFSVAILGFFLIWKSMERPLSRKK